MPRARIIEAASDAVIAIDENSRESGVDVAALAAASTALVIAKERLEAEYNERLEDKDFHRESVLMGVMTGREDSLKVINALLADLLVERPPRQAIESKELMRAPTTDRDSIADPRVDVSGDSMRCKTCRHFDPTPDPTIDCPTPCGYCGNTAIPVASIWIQDATRFGCNFYERRN